MKYSKQLDKQERKRLYGIYIYFKYCNSETFEQFCYLFVKKLEYENDVLCFKLKVP
jgi:hypothetical protein